MPLGELGNFSKPDGEEMNLKVKIALDTMLQRAEASAMSAPKGGLGAYVNRLGWVVSSENQRIAALDRIISYADENNPELAEFARSMRRSTSFVYNPETAIDKALGGDLRINLIATNSDMLNAYMATAGGSVTPEQAQQSVSSALYSLMANEKFEKITNPLKTLGVEVGYSIEEIDNLINNGRSDLIISNILASDFRQELLDAINMNADNVGNTAVKNAARQLGAIRAIQEFFPDINFDGIGKVGLDTYATNLKLSDIVSGAANKNDVSDVITSVLDGFKQVAKGLGLDIKSLPENNIFDRIKAIKQPAAKSKNQAEVTVAEVKAALIKEFELQKDAENYKTVDVDQVTAQVNAKYNQAKKQLKTKKFNPYAPDGNTAATYDNLYLKGLSDKLMDKIKATLTSTDAEGLVGLDLSKLESLEKPFKTISKEGLTKKALFQESFRNLLVENNLISLTEVEQLRQTGTRGQLTEKSQIILSRIQAAKNAATLTTGRTIADFFTEYIQNNIDELPPNPVNLMDQLLFTIQDMKNATSTANPGKSLREEALLGRMLETAMQNPEQLNIKMGDQTVFSLQDLRNYVNIKHNMKITDRYASGTEKMEQIIQGMIEKSAMTSDEKLAASKNLMDQQLLRTLFPVDAISATNVETGQLKSIPKLVELEKVKEVLHGLTGGVGDEAAQIQFLEDFLAMNENLPAASEILENRLRNANKASSVPLNEEELSTQINDLRNRVSSISRRYRAVIDSQSDDYSRLTALFKPGREIASGVLLPDFEPAAVDLGPTKASDAAEDLAKKLINAFGISDAEDQSVNQSLSNSSVNNSGKYTRIQDFLKSAKMQEVYNGLLKNKTKIIGAAAIGTGLAIFGSIRSKERTQESLSGPPLLPGGNPYERIPNTPMNLSEAPIAQGSQGMSYNVSVNGDQDQAEEFMTRARTSSKRPNTRYYE